jgi:hypothetical protein
MLRKSGLISVAAVLLWGCDLFSTREFRSKPSELRSLSGLSKPGDSVAFRATESLWKSGTSVPEQTLSVRRLVFRFAGDSLAAGDTLKILTLTIRADSTGELIESSRRVVRFSPQGVVLEGTATDGSTRFFPLKVSAANSASAVAAALDSTSLITLPALLVEGWDETRDMGILTVTRKQTSVDTLKYQGRLEESWGVSETVTDGARPVAVGKYWYGASGLLKVEQAWAGFGWRNGNGSVPAKAADGSDAVVELRRVLVRL